MKAQVTTVVLVSGGLDSCVAAAVAASGASGAELAFLHVDYGQRTAIGERTAFERIADHYRVAERLVVVAPHFQVMGGSTLTNAQAPLTGDDEGSAPSTYVPFRNANLLAIAVSWAEALGAGQVYLGAHEADAPYPDCRAVFLRAFQRAVDAGTRFETRIELCAPLLEYNKAQIVSLGVELAAPLHLTWSCYDHDDNPCGICHSCQLRARGFREAGVDDPLPTRSP